MDQVNSGCSGEASAGSSVGENGASIQQEVELPEDVVLHAVLTPGAPLKEGLHGMQGCLHGLDSARAPQQVGQRGLRQQMLIRVDVHGEGRPVPAPGCALGGCRRPGRRSQGCTPQVWTCKQTVSGSIFEGGGSAVGLQGDEEDSGSRLRSRGQTKAWKNVKGMHPARIDL